MSDKPPVKRHVGTDRAALLTFVAEAARHGYEIVFVATDVAEALGAPTSTPIPMAHEPFVPDGHALAMPRAALTFVRAGTTAKTWAGVFPASSLYR